MEYLQKQYLGYKRPYGSYSKSYIEIRSKVIEIKISKLFHWNREQGVLRDVKSGIS
jgi:hypothetical protein